MVSYVCQKKRLSSPSLPLSVAIIASQSDFPSRCRQKSMVLHIPATVYINQHPKWRSKTQQCGATTPWSKTNINQRGAQIQPSHTLFASMQNQSNLCYREKEWEMNHFCDETGAGLIPWSPLSSSLLAKPLRVESGLSDPRAER